MKKLHTVLIVVVVGGLLAGLLLISGCTRSGPTGQGYQGGRHAEAGRYADSGRVAAAADSALGRGQGGAGNGGGGLRAEGGGQGFARIDSRKPAEPLQAPGAGGGRGAGRVADQPRYGGSRTAPEAPSSGDGRGFGQGANRSLAPQGAEVDGRSVVESGTLQVLAGSLDADGTEWYLETSVGRYALHFGNTVYVQSTGVKLREGAAVEVRGFVDGQEVAVASIVVDGTRFAFRGDDGVPLWAGRGRQAGTGGGGLRRISG